VHERVRSAVLAVAHECANGVTLCVAHGVTDLCAQRYPNSVAHGSSEHVADFGTDGEPVSGALGGTHCRTICLAICSTDCIPNAGTNSIAVCCTVCISVCYSNSIAIRSAVCCSNGGTDFNANATTNAEVQSRRDTQRRSWLRYPRGGPGLL
jgi:hypothetical protein